MDRLRSLIHAAQITMPLTHHIYCLYHLEGNIATNLCLALGSQWESFNNDFWALYHAVSPDAFDVFYNSLIQRHPDAAEYLSELCECIDRWGWAWISTIFTADVRTSGHVEGENRINKVILGPKLTFLQLFNALNERTSTQSLQEQIRVCEVMFFIAQDSFQF